MSIWYFEDGMGLLASSEIIACFITTPDSNLQSVLRTVPSKYKGIRIRKSKSLQGLLESTKIKESRHAFFRDN